MTFGVYKSDNIKGITEAFKNECWSASGVRLPDDIHSIFRRADHFGYYRKPTTQEVKDAIDNCEKFFKDNNIQLTVEDVFHFRTEHDEDNDEHVPECYYYDHEFQDALRADFVLITGENVFPEWLKNLVESEFNAKCYHLG